MTAERLRTIAGCIRHSDRFQDGKQGPHLAEHWTKVVEEGANAIAEYAQSEKP